MGRTSVIAGVSTAGRRYGYTRHISAVTVVSIGGDLGSPKMKGEYSY